MSQEIITLSEIEQVRLRHGVWLSSLNRYLGEIIENSLDEHLAGYGNKITVIINEDRSFIVSDEGRGLPVEPSDTYKDKSQAEVAFSSIRSGSKFVSSDTITTGLNGIGSAGVNFLSSYFNVTIKRDGIVYELKFEKGQCVRKITAVDTCDINDTGTTINAMPDDEIWADYDYNIPAINRRIKQIAYLNPGLTLVFKANYGDYEIDEEYCYEGGLNEYLDELMNNEPPITDIFRINNKTVALNDEGKVMTVDIIFAKANRIHDNILGFTNNVSNSSQKSSHIAGFKKGLFDGVKDVINTYENHVNVKIESDDVKEGIFGIISIALDSPVYSGQEKDILEMPIVYSKISNIVKEYIKDVLDKDVNRREIIISSVIESAKLREKAKNDKEASKIAKSISNSSKVEGLTKANTKDPSKACLWLTEGDSAAGSAKDARDPEVDAILPVFGKLNNTYNMTLNQILKSPKLASAIKAFGCGIGESFDINKLNYHTIIIMTDADDDGLHIRCLWITFFYVYLRELIEKGHIYIAQPPLYTITANPNTKKAKKYYAYNDSEKDEIINDLGEVKYEIKRNKGLGEQSPEELRESTMAKETRHLVQLTISENAELDDYVLGVCMNDEALQQRKSFIKNKGIC